MTTGYSYAGTTDAKNTYADAARSQEVGLWNQLAWTREKTAAELTYLDAKGLLRLNSEQQGLANIGGPAIYLLTGPLGNAIRGAAAINGIAQAGYGMKQAVDGDAWSAAGNIVMGGLAVLGAGVPKVLGSGVKTAGAAGSDVNLGAKEVAGVPKSPNVTSAITDAEAGTSGLPKLGSLKGEPELPPKNASPDMVRSIERQNEVSKKLAQAGFDVEQLANTGRKGGNPDLRINVDLADVFSPRTNSLFQY